MKQHTEKTGITRRNFLKDLIGGALALELVYVLYGLVGKKKPGLKNSKLYSAGKVSSFAADNIYPFTSGHFYLSCFADEGFLAISMKCTHLGCMVQSDIKTNGFACPCHASKFNKYGEVLSPPATRALDIFPIVFEKGELKVDVDHPIKRQKFESSQLTYM